MAAARSATNYGTRGYDVGRDKIRRLMCRMGVETLYVKPRLSLAHPGHVKYPYLLRGIEITRANHVWATDITYIPMARRFCYLVAVMDWASRMVLSWRQNVRPTPLPSNG